MQLVFVFGTLKQGFCNFPVNQGRRVGGNFATVARYALYIMGEDNLPWLVAPAGTDEGHCVVGQLFEVDDNTLENMDRLERVDQPLWYRRVAIQVQPVEGGAARTAWVYLGNHERMAQEKVHVGPVPEYTQALAAAYPLVPGF